jgi:AcrR family transcriptional regulator
MPLSKTGGNRDAEHPASGGSSKRGKTLSGEPRRSDSEQRERILVAAERLLVERGSAPLGIAKLCDSVGVTRRAFVALFGGRDAMLLALFERIVARLGQTMSAAYRSETVWVDALRAALFELLAFLERRPQVARFLIVESLQGHAGMLARRQQAVSVLARVIEADRPDAETTPPFGAEAVVGAAASVLHGRLLEEPVPSLRELTGPLMGVLVMPYLDASVARDELSRPLPSPGLAGTTRSASRLDLGEANATEVYASNRTARVLEAIAACPEMSDSAIGAAVGIVDRQEVSRLLVRLHDLKLIDDDPSATGDAAGKAWRLTAAGASLLEDLRLPQPYIDPSPRP